MKRRAFAWLLIFAMLISLLGAEAFATGPVEPAAVTYMNSGRTSVAKLSLSQLIKLAESIPEYGNSLYSTTPVISGSNYRIGTLSDNAKKNALGWINYYRASAGLAPVTLSQEANTSAAWGALTMAMSGVFSHYPPKPADMSQEDYQKGRAATSSSNISYAWGYPASVVLRLAVSGQMEDSDQHNISTLGHRRWLLNPHAAVLGVGTANDGGEYYTDVNVFGEGMVPEFISDYDFIAWPASGYNLTETFPVGTPWSVTLNPDKYQKPTDTAVKVKITDKTRNKTWTLDYTTGASYGDNAGYFVVNNDGYGVSNCIIFRPASTAVGAAYAGEYDIAITGLKDVNGKAAEIHYLVKFASVETVCRHSEKELVGKVDATCTEAGYSGDQVCKECGEVVTAGKTIPALGHAWDAGVVQTPATETSEGTKLYTCTRCGESEVRPYHICPTENYVDRLADTHWAHHGIDYCVERGIMGSMSTSKLIFEPNFTLTRAQIATILWKMEGKPEAAAQDVFRDVKQTDWFAGAVNWVYEAGIMNGIAADKFAPNQPANRESFAVILFRYAGAKGMDTSARRDLSGFPDVSKVHSYAAEALSWAVAEGIITGVAKSGKAYLEPAGTATRAQTAVILQRYCEK